MTGRLLLAALTVLTLAGCNPRDTESARTTEEERKLIERIERDPFIRVIDRRRNDDGYLVVTTQQGATRVRYLLAPDTPASKELKIRRIVEDFAIPTSEPDTLGTGPESRGLQH
jgi:hypothetical protein